MNGMNWQAQQVFERGNEHVEQLRRETRVHGGGLRASWRFSSAALERMVQSVRGRLLVESGVDVRFEGVTS